MKTLLTAVLATLVLIFLTAAPAQAQAPAKPDLIEMIEIRGEITAYTATAVKDAVEKINDNAKVKAVVLVVDTPGGGASASAVVYSELAKIKVPVVGFCEYLCASGGVYALMSPSVKYIAVRDDTIGGSVGVVAQMTRFNRLLDWAKIDNTTFKSGALKDTGNPTRELTDADRAYFQSIIDELAVKFYHVVGKARPKITEAQWKEIKTARIFIGPHVVAVGLADQVMTRDEVIAKAKAMSGSKNAFTREELAKFVKHANEAAGGAVYRIDGAGDSIGMRALRHADTIMEVLGEIRAGESVKFSYRMPYQF